jgi:UDP-glucose 4-epimerase
MKILVTGSEGFVGKHVVNIARDRGHEVVELDKKRTDFFALEMDILRGGFDNYLETYDAIIHLAAYIDIKESFEDPFKYVANNLTQLERYRSYKGRFVFASSAAVYGDFSPYGYTKRLGEAMLPKNSISLRMFNPFGPGENHTPETHIVPLLINSVLEDKGITLFQGGKQIRDFIYVEDAALGFVLAAENDFVGYLDLCDKPLSIQEVADLVDADYALEKSLRDDGDTGVLVGNNTDIRFILGWEPQFDVEERLTNWRSWRL